MTRCEVCERPARVNCSGLDVPALEFCISCGIEHEKTCPDIKYGRARMDGPEKAMNEFAITKAGGPTPRCTCGHDVEETNGEHHPDCWAFGKDENRMGDDLTLLITLYQKHPLGDSLVQCALKSRPWEGFDHEHLDENRAKIADLLPMHVKSIGPIVRVERLFEVTVIDTQKPKSVGAETEQPTTTHPWRK